MTDNIPFAESLSSWRQALADIDTTAREVLEHTDRSELRNGLIAVLSQCIDDVTKDKSKKRAIKLHMAYLIQALDERLHDLKDAEVITDDEFYARAEITHAAYYQVAKLAGIVTPEKAAMIDSFGAPAKKLVVVKAIDSAKNKKEQEAVKSILENI